MKGLMPGDLIAGRKARRKERNIMSEKAFGYGLVSIMETNFKKACVALKKKFGLDREIELIEFLVEDGFEYYIDTIASGNIRELYWSYGYWSDVEHDPEEVLETLKPFMERGSWFRWVWDSELTSGIWLMPASAAPTACIPAASWEPAKIVLAKKLNKEDPTDNVITHVGQGLNAAHVEGGVWDLQTYYAENVVGTDYGEGIPCVVLESWTDYDGTGYRQVEISIGDYDYHLKKDVFFRFRVIIESKYVELI